MDGFSFIRKMTQDDSQEVLGMMRTFYASPAVHTCGSEEIFRRDVEFCTGDSPYAEGFVFCEGEKIFGYAMIAKSYSTEFGKPCVWIEDLYFLPEFRGRGIGGKFLNYIDDLFPDCVLRLEVEPENERAVRLYRKCGYEVLPYSEMKKERKK